MALTRFYLGGFLPPAHRPRATDRTWVGPQRFAVCRTSQRAVCHQEVGALSLGSARGSDGHGAWGLYLGPPAPLRA